MFMGDIRYGANFIFYAVYPVLRKCMGGSLKDKILIACIRTFPEVTV